MGSITVDSGDIWNLQLLKSKGGGGGGGPGNWY